MMIDKNDFLKMSQELEKHDAQREILIKKSRDILKLSKEAIYSVHRNELASATESIGRMDKEMNSFQEMVKGHEKLRYSGTYKITVQEYVEAVAFYSLMKDKRIPSSSEIGEDAELYLLGLCDLTGELVRRAINAAIKEDYGLTIELKDFVSELYGELMKFDFGNGELRKKYDSIKYDLKKLEDLALELKLKGKI